MEPSQRTGLIEDLERKSTDESNQTGVWTKKKSYKERVMEFKLPTLKYRSIRGDMIEVYKLLMNTYDDNTIHLDMHIDTRTRGHTKKLVKRFHYDVWKYSFCIRVVNIWNDVITATSVNSFRNRLDYSGQIKKFCIIIKSI